MDYSEEEVYTLVGKHDKTATVSFKPNSDSYKLYGPNVTVLFLYTQYEREDLDKRIKDPNLSTKSIIKVKHLYSELDSVKIKKLESIGINTDDIAVIGYLTSDPKNTFHSKEQRSITKIEVPMKIQLKGRDIDWIYGFSKRLVESGKGLSPKEMHFYLACKYFYESDKLSSNELSEIFDDSENMKIEIEFEYLKIKYEKVVADDADIKRLGQLIIKKDNEDLQLLDKYLKESGSSLSKFSKENLNSAANLLIRINGFHEKSINVTGRKAIYLDVDRYLHVHMRHVEEMKINKHFAHKSNFQWDEEDILIVLDKIIEINNDKIQEFFKSNPGKRYSCYGRKSIYFEGDYYTLHIESNGAISTFYRIWKEDELRVIEALQ